MTAVFAMGVMPQSTARAGGLKDLLDDVPYGVWSVVGDVVVSLITKDARDEVSKASSGRDYSTALANFQRDDASTRQIVLNQQGEGFFRDRYGLPKATMIAIHNGLCGRKSADAEFAINEGSTSPAGGKAMTVAEVEANLPSEHILLQSHLRGAGDKEGWQPALLTDEPSKFDGCIVVIDHLPAKIEVVGDVNSSKVNVAWYKAKKYVQNPDGSYQMNPDGSYFLAAKSQKELDQEVVQKGQYFYFLPLGYDIPVEASRLSLAVSIWDKNPDAEEPDEVANFLLTKQRSPLKAEAARVSSVIPSIRRDGGTAVAMSSSLVEALCVGGHHRVDDVKLAMLPAS